MTNMLMYQHVVGQLEQESPRYVTLFGRRIPGLRIE